MSKKKINDVLGLTDAEIEARALEYENDTWDASHLGKVVMGRPSIANEEARL